MRHTKTYLLVLILIFFNLNAQNASENDQKKIIGEWAISGTKSIISENETQTETETLCNVCPKVNFTIDQNAIIVNSVGKREIYIWKIVGNKISFVNIGSEKVDNETFSGEYELKFSQEKDFIELELINNKNSSIILRK